MRNYQISGGFIELIVGCMFAGKTEELIRKIFVYRRAKKEVLVFKPSFDNRIKSPFLESHSKIKIPAHIIKDINQIDDIIEKYNQNNKKKIEVLAFDEIQFFIPEICQFIEKKANQGYRILCAGLDKGFNDKLFETVLRLLAQAEFVIKLMAVCVICGDMASKTQRIDKNGKEIGPAEVKNVIGGSDVYQARCRKCFKFFD